MINDTLRGLSTKVHKRVFLANALGPSMWKKTKHTSYLQRSRTETSCDVTCYEYSYEGWNFNSGNYLFTTDTK